MANRADVFYFRDAQERTRIPVADGQFFTGSIPVGYRHGNCYLRFLDANGDAVTPTGGTITFVASPIQGQFLTPPTVQSINAVDVEATNASYTPPTFNSLAIDTRMTLSGVQGAAFVEAWHWRTQ